MAHRIKITPNKIQKLAASIDELETAFDGVVNDLKAVGTPVIFVKHAALGKTDLKYSKSSAVAKSIYKAPEFQKK